MDVEVIKNKADDKLKNIGLGVKKIYKAKSGYIISTYLLKNPEAPLNDCLYIIENDGNFREYGMTENPEELTDAISNKDNILYSRKGNVK